MVGTSYSDRFIPSRSSTSHVGFSLPENQYGATPSASAAYLMLLRSELDLLGPIRDSTKSPPSPNILSFKSDTRTAGPRPESTFSVSPAVLEAINKSPLQRYKNARSAFEMLDAPDLGDDFYLNLMDWSANNVLAVGLGSCVYLWNASNSEVTKLCDLGPSDTACSVAWTQRGPTYLAVGTHNGDVQIWDTGRCRKVRTLEGHETRVGSLACGSVVLSSGSSRGNILNHDIRVQGGAIVSKLGGHTSEVCGLKWSFDDRELASGGNDNQLFVWNQLSNQPVLKFSEHTAAVKAIAWSPHQHGLLASGGGTADGCIRFWNTSTSSRINCVDTGSQVCNLIWSKSVNELLSTHGYSEYQLILWRYPALTKLETLRGHRERVLYVAMSPDGQTIVTGAADETLRFWNIFPSPKSQNSVPDTGIWSRAHLR